MAAASPKPKSTTHAPLVYWACANARRSWTANFLLAARRDRARQFQFGFRSYVPRSLKQQNMKILIADDHAIVRHGLKQILADEFKKANFGEARNGQEVLDFIWKDKWDVVVLDITMPGRSGLEVLKEIKKAQPRLPVLVLSMHPEDQFAVRVLKSGASGYMTKESAPNELVGAVRKIMAGGRHISTSVAEIMASDLTMDSDRPRIEQLW